MPKTLLAVDDSVTMRKVIEMTFAGEDMRVIAVPTPQDALAACGREHPDAALVDVSLDPINGYDLCKKIKEQFKGVPVVLLSSQQNPFNAAKAQAAGADDHIDKPYDTTKALDLIKKVMVLGKGAAPAQISPTPVLTTAGSALPGRPSFSGPPLGVTGARPAESRSIPVSALGSRPGTSVPVAPPPKGTSHAVPPAAPAPQPLKPREPEAQPAFARPSMDSLGARSKVDAVSPIPGAVLGRGLPGAAQAANADLRSEPRPSPVGLGSPKAGPVNGVGNDLPAKLESLGLNSAQVEAVLALSRDVVERVVWEVVPAMAETMVREEIARLTKE